MERATNENKVYILAPTGRDASLVCSILERTGIEAEVCGKVDDLLKTVAEGAGAVLVAEEALTEPVITSLVKALEQQHVWSDLPVIIFSSSSRNAESILQALSNRINATVVERPIRITMLVSAVKGALRARQRQYQTRDLLEQLEQSDKQKDLFLATLSHELRTPLNSILGWLQILKTGPNGIEKLRHALDVIERNAKAQSEIISDILFVSRIVTGKLELKRQRVDISAVIRGAAEIVKPLLDGKKIGLEMVVGPGETEVVGDPERLQQIFLNLLSNAAKFTKRRGQISVNVRSIDEEIEISVSDNGRGISKDFLPYVFDRFRQADSTFTRRVGGLGLGLAIVKHLTELHGGRVIAQSEGKNRGATFVIRLPLAGAGALPEPADSRPRIRQPTTNGLTGLRVLLVEDDADSREMLSAFLETHGINVSAVKSANEAIEQVSNFQPEVLISDVGLPERDGYDLVHDLRQLPATAGGAIPAIALTGYASLQDREKAISAGFQEHLSKPVDVDDLIHVIRRLAPERAHH